MRLAGSSTPTVIATEWVLIAFGAVLILARFYLRLKINRQHLVISDIFICLAWCSAVACSSSDVVFFRMGILHPGVDSNLNGYDGHELQRVLIVRGPPCRVASLAAQCAALLGFYLQIVPDFFTIYRAILWATIVYTGLGFIISVLLNLVISLPVKRNRALDGTGCFDETVRLFHIAWALYFSSDIIIFFLPFYLFHTVPIRRLSVRLALYCVFGLGIIEIAITLTRYVALNLPPDSKVPFTNIGKSWLFCSALLWTAIDANLGVVIAALPPLRPYLQIFCSGRKEHPASRTNTTWNVGRGRFARHDLRLSDMEGTTAGQNSVSRTDRNKDDVSSQQLSRGGFMASGAR
ncbi:hypothetical protein BKA56DRAFT_504308 [Ilyonectria sp. MPI-CAGE-AT-0026]|nr:hypothetical protein BKA56DRAFT_504308 [Ilyonectria sp. MPI-CAGE-AT-0026]